LFFGSALTSASHACAAVAQSSSRISKLPSSWSVISSTVFDVTPPDTVRSVLRAWVQSAFSLLLFTFASR
jgi:hypothetical protein